jgi:hypothetical protein
MMSAAFEKIARRVDGGVAAHDSNASAAASTACSTSSGPPTATVA